MKILQHFNGVYIFPRKGKRLYSGDGLPAELKSGGALPMYVTSIDIQDFDVTGKVICLNDKRILYEFGKGFGTITVKGEVLLGRKDLASKKTGNLGKLIDFFNQKRVSASPKPLSISSGRFGGTYKFYLTSFSAGGWNAEFGVCNFTMSGDLVDMTK